MASQGVTLLADLDRLAVLGFTEVVRHMPDLARLRRGVRRFLAEQGVDLFVPIDYPGFNLPLAAFARRRSIPVLYYIAPQVWAWHESRARKLARDTDLVCVVLPFEAEHLERWGVNARFVGHPLLDRLGRRPGSGATTRPPVLGIFPGSRKQEVERMLPPFLAAARILQQAFPELEVGVARAQDLALEVYGDLQDATLISAEELASEARAAITKSGTITLQLALAGVPMVVGYRVNQLTYRLARRLVRVDHIALVNLVAGTEVVPELVQDAVTPALLASATRPLLDPNHPARATQVRGLAEVVARLGAPGAAARVAEECLRLLRREV